MIEDTPMRARNIKPSLFTNEHLAAADPIHTLIFIGLWCLADREGRLPFRPAKIHFAVNPGRAIQDTEDSLRWLEQHGFIASYEVAGARYIEVINFRKHQNPHQRESPSEIPPRTAEGNRYLDEPVSSQQRQRILERDGNRCVWCGSADDLHIDHIHPRSRGGTSDDSNLQALCGPCNTSKGARVSQGSDKAQPRQCQAGLIPDSGFLIPDCGSLITERPELPKAVEIESIKPIYPKRAGGQAWQKAAKALHARLNEGASLEAIKAGVQRYAAFIEATGKSGTEFVMMAATFLGPEKHYDEPWDLPRKPETPAERRAREAREKMDAWVKKGEANASQ